MNKYVMKMAQVNDTIPPVIVCSVMSRGRSRYISKRFTPFKMDAMLYANIKSKILLHLMGTLKLFYDFLNEPLHWCDVKFDNFGLSADYPKRFMIMDADMVFTESRMQHLMESLRCKSDADCQFFDCSATCIPSTGHCSKRTNDNVDVFCKKLVYELFGPFGRRPTNFSPLATIPMSTTRNVYVICV